MQVNRARYMPQNPSVIATKTPTSEVIASNLFDLLLSNQHQPTLQCNSAISFKSFKL